MFASERGSGSNIKVNAKDFLFSRLIMVLSVTALALLMLIRARSYQYLVRTGKSTSMQMKVHF